MVGSAGWFFPSQLVSLVSEVSSWPAGSELARVGLSWRHVCSMRSLITQQTSTGSFTWQTCQRGWGGTCAELKLRTVPASLLLGFWITGHHHKARLGVRGGLHLLRGRVASSQCGGQQDGGGGTTAIFMIYSRKPVAIYLLCDTN